jgi:RNA polymerase sigma factor (sigma-70 family)
VRVTRTRSVVDTLRAHFDTSPEPGDGSFRPSRSTLWCRVQVRQASLSEQELVSRCRAGDEAAWYELVERFSRYVYAIAVQGFRLPPHDAEDVFQEVFARAYEHLGKLRNDNSIRPWLAQLTRRACIDRLRDGARVQPGVEEEDSPDPDDVIAVIDEALDMHDALAELSGQCQDILDRFFARDESYRQIAEELDLPSGTIASRISRCLTRLRTQLEGRSPRPAASGDR